MSPAHGPPHGALHAAPGRELTGQRVRLRDNYYPPRGTPGGVPYYPKGTIVEVLEAGYGPQSGSYLRVGIGDEEALVPVWVLGEAVSS